jgi:hypothetical protein
MTGTAYCRDCNARAEQQGGPGTPLIIRHDPNCPLVAHKKEKL